ncbi:MAG TPA: FixH family protein, partial [Actinomycetota bacterium]|nr:FixH family protein [Actinomycetota bacterium]
GVYTVTWRTVSKADGHVTAGSFSFGVGAAPPATAGSAGTVAGAGQSPTVLDTVGRWLLYWGLAILLAAAVVGLVAFDARLPGPRWIPSAAWFVAAVGLVLVLVAERSAVGVSFGALLRSGAGRSLVWQGVSLFVVAAAVGVWGFTPNRDGLVAISAAAAAAMLVHAMGGHAGAASSALSRWFDIGVQWLHLLSVGVWVGGLAWLLLGTRGTPDEERAASVRRFSWLAGVALAAVAVTGVLRAIDEVGLSHWSRLVSTGFGVTLLVKTGIFVALVALGARNRYVNVPRFGDGSPRAGSLRRAVGAELILAAGVLGATAVLTQLPPAATIAAAGRPAVPQQLVVAGHDFATSVRVRLIAAPGTVGPNQFTVTVTDFDTGRPVPASAVSLRFAMPANPAVSSTLSLRGGPGATWRARGTALALDGRWTVTVLVQEAATSVEVPLQLQTRLPPQQIQVSRQPGQPTLYTITLPGGGQLQAYVDPGKVGPNTVHFTFFTATGTELPIESATATRDGPIVSGPMPLVRFSAGHFVANQDLSAGSWRFAVTATARDGRTLTGYFTEQIGG